MIAAGLLPIPGDLALRIDPADYARLLGYPEGELPTGRSRRLADRSRSWYAARGRPWAVVRALAIRCLDGEQVALEDGSRLASRVLARRLAGASALAVAALSAGPEVDVASADLWQRERGDAAYCLDRFGAAVAEHLAAWTGRYLRGQAVRHGLAALPGYSPGYDGWPLEQQITVARALAGLPPGDGAQETILDRFSVLESGMIQPKNSLIAVFGLTSDQDEAAAAWKQDKCSWCSLARCAFRRPRARGSHQGGVPVDAAEIRSRSPQEDSES